jgi:hypothetical protein
MARTKKPAMKMLGRDDFLNFEKELVEVPELEGSVYIRDLGGKSLLKYKERIDELSKINLELDVYNSIEIMSLLVSLTACDENDNLIFTEDDVKKLSEKNLFVLMRLSTKALEVSGMSQNVINEVTSKLKNAPQDSSIIS